MQPGAWKHESIRESTYTGNFRWYAGRLQHLVCIIPSWRYNAFPSGLEELAPSHFMNIIQVQKGQQRCFSELNYCYSDNLISNLAHTLLSQTVPLWYRDALYPQLPNAIPWKVKSKKKKKRRRKKKKKKNSFWECATQLLFAATFSPSPKVKESDLVVIYFSTCFL